MITRVPCASCMPSGSVTRKTFFASPSGSISTAATTGIPDSMRASLPVKQTCLGLLASCPLRQNLVHGEKINCGCVCSLACPSCCGAGGGCCASGAGGGADGFLDGGFG